MPRDILGFLVNQPNAQHRFRVQVGTESVWVQISEDLPIRKYDLFSGTCELDGNTWVPIEKPFFSPNPTKTSILNAFQSALKRNVSEASLSNIYGYLLALKGTPRKLAEFISESANDSKLGKEIDPIIFNDKLNKEQISQLLDWWHWHWSRRSLLLLGIPSSELEDLHRFSFTQLHTQLIKDPIEAYELDMDLTLEIAERLGIEIEPEDQFMGAVVRFIYACSRHRKWAGVPLEILLGTFTNLQEDTQLLVAIIKRFQIHFDQTTQMLLLPFQNQVQELLATKIQTLLDSNNLPRKTYSPKFTQKMDPDQEKAVSGALNSQISMIVGPAGSGKTSVISQLIYNLNLQGKKFALVSFTGKAVSRIRKCTGEAASTMDRMICANPEARFETLIMDEAGMTSNELLYRFLKTFDHQFQLILIGDPYQLQPLSWGNFFREMIGFLPTFRLTQNHRLMQVDTETNSLPQNLIEMINDPDYVPICSETFEVDPPEIERPLVAVQQLVSIIAEEESDPNSVTVLCPYRVGGDLDRINEMISIAFNGEKKEVTCSNGKTFRVGDRVKMCKNDHLRGIYNGEEGLVVDLDQSKVRVRFDGELEFDFETFVPKFSAPYQPLNISKLTLSFAKTVYEDQGDEHRYVVFWIPHRKHSRAFLNQPLIYTAISRARVAAYCIGDTGEFVPAARAQPAKRHDNLRAQIQKLQK